MQISKLYRYGIIAAGMVVATATMLGCSEDAATESAEESAASSPQMNQRKAPSRPAPAEPVSNADENEDFRVMPSLNGSLDEDGMGLDVIIDASSKQAYADSLEWISQDASKEQFAKLENAIRYMHMYDPAVLGREAELLATLDGKTGHEVIARAQELMKERRGQN
ncbi:MAG TPA: hypothetical protein VJ908_12905 [Wenzhouxiangellaceae bacterium]|nr:hypothetical protein [Wenzhouxiangellaceae bacterium]